MSPHLILKNFSFRDTLYHEQNLLDACGPSPGSMVIGGGATPGEYIPAHIQVSLIFFSVGNIEVVISAAT